MHWQNNLHIELCILYIECSRMNDGDETEAECEPVPEAT